MQHRSTAFVFAVFLGAIMTAGAGGESTLLPEQAPADWHLAAKSQELIYMGKAEPPTLELPKAAMTDGWHTLKFSTDAERIVMSSGKQSVVLDLAIRDRHGRLRELKGGGTLRFDGRVDSPKLIFDQTPLSEQLATWVRLVNDDEADAVVLRFEKAKYAVVQVDPTRLAGAGNGRATRVGWFNVALGQAPAELRETVSPTLWRVRITHGTGAAQTRVVVPTVALADGFFAVHADAVEGAGAAEVLGPDAEKAVPLELWSASRETGLALLRATAPDDLPEAMKPVKLRSQPPELNEIVWAAGYDSDKIRLNKATLLSRPQFAEISRVHKLSLTYGTRTLWLETDALNDETNAGGGLYDQQGRLIGLLAFLWLDRQGYAYAISGVHIAQMLADRPDAAIGFEKFQPQPVVMPPKDRPWELPVIPPALPGVSMPQLDTSAPAEVALLFRNSNLIRTLSGCRVCNDSGTQSVKVLTGYKELGGYRKPIYEMQPKPCGTCKGTRFAQSERLLAQVNIVLRELARIDAADPRTKRALDHAVENLVNLAEFHPDGFARIANPGFVDKFELQQHRIGEPVVIDAILRTDSPRMPEDIDDLALLVVTAGDSVARVLTRDPVVKNAANGDRVFAGGVISGFAIAPDGVPIPIIERGTLIKVPLADPAEDDPAEEQPPDRRRRR